MRTNEVPYESCLTCKTLADCPYKEKAEGLSGEMPPDNCPKPIEIMRHTLNKRKLDRYKRY